MGNIPTKLSYGPRFVDGGTVPPDGVFWSDWATAAGQSAAALRDTSKPLPWDFKIGNGTLNTVVSAAGLDFPTTNVYQNIAQWNGNTSGQVVFTDHVRLDVTNGHIPIPSVGGHLFYRYYVRVNMPDGLGMGNGGSHPVQDAHNGSGTNWMHGYGMNNPDDPEPAAAGMWSLGVIVNAAPFPRHIHRSPDLNKNQTYRVEFDFHRDTSTTNKQHIRIYNSSDVLLLDDNDFTCREGDPEDPADSLAAYMASNSFPNQDLNNLQSFQVGCNGINGPVDTGAFPFNSYAFGAVAVRTADWCGPYNGVF